MRLRHFDADRAAADDYQMPRRHPVRKDGLVGQIRQPVEPGDRRNERTRACRDHKPPRPDFDIAGAHRARAGEARFGAQNGDAEPFKPLGEVVGCDVGNHPLNAVADRGEIDLWPHLIDAKQRSSAPEIREPGRGEQRL